MPGQRFRIDGHVYYITTNVYNRLPLFTRPSFVVAILDSLHFYRYQYDCKLLGYVIMPDHLHLLLWPQQSEVIPDFMRDFKTFTAKRMIRQVQVEKRNDWLDAFHQAGTETKRSHAKVWQDEYWDKNIYSERFLRQRLNYIHRNPVRAGLVSGPEQYPYSSYQNYVTGTEYWLEIDRGWL